MPDFGNETDSTSDSTAATHIPSPLYAAAYGATDWWGTAMHCGKELSLAVGTQVVASLHRKVTTGEGQVHLLQESALAAAFGVCLRSWRTTPWPITCALGGTALLFAREELNPSIVRNARRNLELRSSITDLISHRGARFDHACTRVGKAVGEDLGDILVTGSFLLAGALPRLSRMSCGTVTMYTSEGWRMLFERESKPLAALVSIERTAEKSASSVQELHSWVSSLNQRGLRATLTFAEDGKPMLQPPSLPDLPGQNQPGFVDPQWWRDPAHPHWHLTDFDDTSGAPQIQLNGQ